MGSYANEQWYLEAKAKWFSQYGEIPPPWIYSDTSHPLGIGWRMGGGESFLMTLWEWWEEANMTESEMLAYFKKYNPPPRWLGWVCEVIWDLDEDLEEDFDYTAYFNKLAAAGYEGIEDFEQDYDDPKWIELQ